MENVEEQSYSKFERHSGSFISKNKSNESGLTPKSNSGVNQGQNLNYKYLNVPNSREQEQQQDQNNNYIGSHYLSNGSDVGAAVGHMRIERAHSNPSQVSNANFQYQYSQGQGTTGNFLNPYSQNNPLTQTTKSANNAYGAQNNSQGGSSLQSQELLNCQKKSSLSKWEIIGGNSGQINKQFDKTAKSIVVQLTEKGSKLRFPRTNNTYFVQNLGAVSSDFESLDLQNDIRFTQTNQFGETQFFGIEKTTSNPSNVQTIATQSSFLIQTNPNENKPSSHSILSQAVLLQIMVPENEKFSLEFSLLDLQRVRRSLIFTNVSNNQVHVSDNFAVIPNSFIKRRIWLNLVIDLKNLYNSLYKGCTYRSLEGIEISSVCKIRRVMTLNNNQIQLIQVMRENSGPDQSVGINNILPQTVLYPHGVTNLFQYCNYESSVVGQDCIIKYDQKQQNILQFANDHLQSIEGQDVSSSFKIKNKVFRLSPVPSFIENNNGSQTSQYNPSSTNQTFKRQKTNNNQRGNSPGAVTIQQNNGGAFSKKKQSSHKNLVVIDKNGKLAVPGQNLGGVQGFQSTKSSNNETSNLKPRAINQVETSSNKRAHHALHLSDANTTFSTRKKSIPSVASHTFVSDDNFHLSSQQKGGSSSIGAGATQTIHNTSINAQSDLQSTMRVSQQFSNERGQFMHQRLNNGKGSTQQNKEQLSQINHMVKNVKGKKIHPLSAVQRTNKLGNNLYSVVNNKLVRNIQGQHHNTNSSHQNIDRLLTDFESNSAAKFSPSPSEERIHGLSGRIQSKSQKRQSGNHSDANNNSFNTVIDTATFNNMGMKVIQNTQQAIEYFKMKHQILRPSNQSDISDSLSMKDQVLLNNSMMDLSPINDRDLSNTKPFIQRRLGGGGINHHDYSTGSLPQIDEVTSPIPTNQVSRLQMISNKGTPNLQTIKPSNHTPKFLNPVHQGANPSQNEEQPQYSKFSSQVQPKINIFPVNKLSTAMAWHEESIREENEFAENDEGGMIASQNSNNSTPSRGRPSNVGPTNASIKRPQFLNKRAGNTIDNRTQGNRNNKMRSSHENGISNSINKQNAGKQEQYQKLQSVYSNPAQNHTSIVVVNSQNVKAGMNKLNAPKGFYNVDNPTSTLHFFQSNLQTINQQNNQGHLNRNIITNGHKMQQSQQQRYASQVKERSYNQTQNTITDGTKVTFNNGEATIQLNDKLQSLNKQRGKIKEIESRYGLGEQRDLTRIMVNKSELIPQQPNLSQPQHFISMNIEQDLTPQGNMKGTKAKIKTIKAKNETKKIYRAYNIEPEQQVPTTLNQQTSAQSQDLEQNIQKIKKRGQQQAASVKRKDIEEKKRSFLGPSGDSTPNNNFKEKRDNSDNSNLNSARARGTQKKGSINTAKTAGVTAQSIGFKSNNGIGGEPTDIENESQSQFEIFNQAKPSQRQSRQGKYVKHSIQGQKSNLRNEEEKSTSFYFDYPPQRQVSNNKNTTSALGGKNTPTIQQQSNPKQSINQYKARQNQRQVKAPQSSSNTKKLNPSGLAALQEQQKLLQRLNHNYYPYNGVENGVESESQSSMIEEQIEREQSEANLTYKSGCGSRRTTAGGTQQRRKRMQVQAIDVDDEINVLSNQQEDEADEFDADYDNLVVSDILGTSGLPSGVVSLNLIQVNNGVASALPGGGLIGQRPSNTLSLYDFT